MPDLEQELSALAAFIAWPEMREFHLPIHGEVAREAGGRGRILLRSRWALAAAAVLVIAAMLVAYTPTRDAIAGWLNVHTRITRTENPPTPSAHPSGPLGQSLDLGTATTLAGAQRQVGWPILAPAALGTPDGVYLKLPPAGPSGGEVSLVYAVRPGIPTSRLTGVAVLVTEARGHTDEQFFGKTVGPDATIEPVTVGGHSGYWISGSPHVFVFTAADGTPYFDTLRLATNTLILDDGGTVVRVEGDLTRDQAIEIGRSLA